MAEPALLCMAFRVRLAAHQPRCCSALMRWLIARSWREPKDVKSGRLPPDQLLSDAARAKAHVASRRREFATVTMSIPCRTCLA